MVDFLERLKVLLKQDRTKYKCEDYLTPSFQQRLLRDVDLSLPPASALDSASTSSTSSSSSGINEVWREKICEWSYQVVDHFDFSREVVSISISFLDRYLATRPVDKKWFQLAAMTTLYMAIKLYEPRTLSMASMIELSRGYFMVEQMAAMEMSILQALCWHVHPPTPFCLSRHFLHLLPVTPQCSLTVRHDLLELARFLTELSVIDYFFVAKRASSIALAAILNAMDNFRAVPFSARMEFLSQLQLVDNFDPNDPEIEDCRTRLQELYLQGGYSQSTKRARDTSHDEYRTETVSPVCVSAVFAPNSGAIPKPPIYNQCCASECRAGD